MKIQLIRMVFATLVSIELIACGGGGTTPHMGSSPGPGTVQLRFVNASPDAGYPDPLDASLGAPLNAAYVSLDGAQVTTMQAGPAYVSSAGFNGVPLVASAAAYINAAAGAKSVLYTPAAPSPGAGGNVGPFTLPNLTAGHRYTVVLAGSYCLHSLQVYTFDDGTASGSGTVAVYNVAPDAPQPAYDFGFFNPSAGPQPGAPNAGSVALGKRAAVPAPSDPAGFGVWVVDQSQAVVGSVLPSDVDPFDANNVVPYNALSTFSVFITDTAQRNFGGAILCANEQFGAPNVVAGLSP
ncbi:MAG TPA: hypothetical protein VFE17_10455 [Candidatus Baltobacteraceae bacterium]|jgi:hypothetical protein|nr:hypothetical protein [Candidatus Baltobacteraceae bacterium]